MKLRIAVLVVVIGSALARAQSDLEKKLFDLVNQERARAKVGKLEWNDKLAEAALGHSKLLDQHQDLSHQFDGEPPVQQRVGATGLRFDMEAENVAEAPDIETAHEHLMRSPGHRQNILSDKYNALGIAIVQHGRQLFVTEDFAHVTNNYTEKSFQDAIISSVNRARRARKLPRLDIIADARLRTAACSHDLNTNKMIQTLPGVAGLVVFSQSEPDSVPVQLRDAVADPTFSRMNIGVCMESGGRNGFTHFWVVAAFYPGGENSQQ